MTFTCAKISVCLPVWNGEKYLEAALNSLLSQSFENFEVVISDDESTDSSAQIIEKFAKVDRRIVLLPKSQHCGLFQNYNRCITHSRGDIIKFFAQDDLLRPDALATIDGAFTANPTVGLVSSNKVLIDQSGELITGTKNSSIESYFPEHLGKPIDGISVVSKILTSGENFIGEPAAVAIRKSAVREGFDPSFTHIGDLEYWLRVLLVRNMIYINETLYSFRIHDSSQSKRNRDNLFAVSDTFRMARKHEKLCQRLNIDTTKQLREFTSAVAGQIFADHQNAPLDLSDIRCGEKLLNDLAKIPGQTTLERATDELLLFRELAYHGLMALGELNDHYRHNVHESAKIMRREKQIAVLEYELGQVLSSISWKSTRVLREFNTRLFGRAANKQLMSLNLEENEGNLAAIAERQESYLTYLRKFQSAILASRSWKLTSPLRILSGTKKPKPTSSFEC